MKLGLMLGYSGAELDVRIKDVQLAERLGYDSVWTAEAYGSDAITPLAFIAAQTDRIKLGTAVIQLGVSGPQIVEGWYGQPWGKPYYRIKDYVSIMKKIWRREEPVVHEGREITLPYTGEGSLGLGKPLTSILHMNPDIPIYLGTGMEATVRLTAEIADGWLPLGYVPESAHLYDESIDEGLKRSGRTPDQFDRQAMAQVNVTEDVRGAIDRLKPGIALYVGGMGHKSKNFHNEMMIRRGYPEAAARIQELYLARRKDEAIAAVPDEFVDEGALLGTPERIKKRFAAWEGSGVSGLTISGDEQAIRTMAEVARLNTPTE